MTAPVDVLAENVEVRLWDSQWVNVVNHADCYRDMDKEEAIATAVRMTERLMAENITKGFPPSAYNRVAVAELTAALRIAVRQNSHDMLMTGEELRICESAIAKAKATGVQS